LATHNIVTDPLNSIAASLANQGQTSLWVAVDGVLAGIIAVADTIKPTSRSAIDRFKQLGLRTVLLSGDQPATVRALAAQAGIDEAKGSALPEDKANTIRQWQSEGQIVAMVGDGINDSPALATADVGIAMGSGSDIAIESAGVTLMRNDLMGVAQAITLSRITMRIVRQNLFWAFAYNVAGIPIAAGILYPITGTLLTPVMASLAMAFSSVSVVLNSLRLTRIKLDK